MEAIEDNTEGEKKLFIPDPNSDSRCLIRVIYRVIFIEGPKVNGYYTYQKAFSQFGVLSSSPKSGRKFVNVRPVRQCLLRLAQQLMLCLAQ